MKTIVIWFSLCIMATSVFAQMQSGGGWSVKSFVDEFGDPTGSTYYETYVQGTYTTDIAKNTGTGRIYCFAYTQKSFGVLITRNGNPITWFLPIKDQFTLAIKDLNDGKTYRFPCIGIQNNQEFLFSLTGDLARLLHSDHRLQFALSEQMRNSPLLVVASFTMTGELPTGGL
ncbi:MAG: hypothetical protein LBG80_20430 [Bacteroidales bacterium]|jgi:hypothetical protein|nr:hypothetical protein [Bacteroidales bacterium]